jgi:GT2 family glycosyltransferase/tetratricopeptide (TPR) repeat protein
MAIRNVAVIFDNKVRADTTGYYCHRALGGLVNVEHFLPSDAARIPRNGFDLFLHIDDGLRYSLPSELRPCAWWAIDTHLDWSWYESRAHDYNFIFAAQRDGMERFKEIGLGSALWLPLACDPEIHCKHDIDKSFDFCFIGNLFPGYRQELVELLQKCFLNHLVGQRFFDDMARAYSASRLVFNRSIRNDVNMRVFEALACGSLLLTNDLAENGQADMFLDARHFASYVDADELLYKANYYLANESVRERIAAAGRAEVLLHHTYRHRMQRILALAEQASSSCTMAVSPQTRAKKHEPESPVKADESLTTPSAGYLASRLPDRSDVTSIVILTHNQLDFTRLCVDSIRRCTEEPYELVLVDNASTDGTTTYLKSLEGATVICNADNRGFPAGVNQGIQASKGEQVLLLNNDIIATAGWLRRLLRVLHSDKRIGLVGPCSNCVSGEQQISARYQDLDELETFAQEWATSKKHVVEDTDRLVGFCLLIRRTLIDKIGVFDERFGIGCFEDDDYCRRAVSSGFRAVIARDAFVHHFGSQTFRSSGIDFEALLRHNQELYVTKWAGMAEPANVGALPTRSDRVSRKYGLQLSNEGGLLLLSASLQLSLCMIVRDNCRTIRPCLESIRPWVDEMVVVDTGSTDETPAIARKLGARVFHFPWCDSFSAARNESLRHARGRWIFWMDSDDTIDDQNGRRLRQLALKEPVPEVFGFVMQVHCPEPEDQGNGDITVVDQVKFFRNLPALRFEGRIHEQVIPSIRRAGGEIAWSDVFVIHSGCDHSPEGRTKKNERDLYLLDLELKEQPEHPFTLFNLGMTYADIQQFEAAVEFLRRCLAVSNDGESHLRKAYALLVHSYSRLGDADAAWKTLNQGLQIYPKDAELLFRKALLFHESSRLPEAKEAYLKLLQTDDDRHFSSVVRGMKSFLARHNLALIHVDLGDNSEAERQWQLVLAEVPDYPPAVQGLAELFARANRHAEASALTKRLLDKKPSRMHGVLLNARIAEARGDYGQARRVLEDAVAKYSGAIEPLQALSRLLFEHEAPAEAEWPLRELVERSPLDGANHHNLGTLYMKQGRFVDAVGAYRQSLKHRPNFLPTSVLLGKALEQCGSRSEVVTAWIDVLKLDAQSVEATQGLQKAAAAPV